MVEVDQKELKAMAQQYLLVKILWAWSKSCERREEAAVRNSDSSYPLWHDYDVLESKNSLKFPKKSIEVGTLRFNREEVLLTTFARLAYPLGCDDVIEDFPSRTQSELPF